MRPITILTVSVLATMAGCASSPPKMPSANEATRRPANDPAYIEMLKLRSEIDELKQRTNFEDRTEQARALLAQAQNPMVVRTALGLQPGALAVRPNGANVIYTARFAMGGTKLALSPQASSVLASAARQAPVVVIRGRTDATQSNAKDERIARARAESARSMLMQLGVDGRRIRTTWQSAGDNVAPLDTTEGRAANRRVEIELYAAEPAHGTLDERASFAQQ
jgi:outer membrane protein OmpA-like peptidoglycan-associated protein